MVINDYLLNEGFVQSKADNCIYVKTEDDLLFVGVYVDDIISVGKLPAVNLFRKKLRDHFKITDGGPLEWYLGVAFVQNDDFTISLNQNQYVAQKLEEFAPYCEKGGVSTPLPLDYQRILEEAEKEETIDTDFPYRQIVGSLMYAMLATRPDICVAVSVLSRYLDKPKSQHISLAKHLLRYLKGNSIYCLTYKSDNSTTVLAYANDANYKSRTGYCCFLGSSLISWYSGIQSVVAQSSAEAEYYAAAAVSNKCLWLKQLF